MADHMTRERQIRLQAYQATHNPIRVPWLDTVMVVAILTCGIVLAVTFCLVAS